MSVDKMLISYVQIHRGIEKAWDVRIVGYYAHNTKATLKFSFKHDELERFLDILLSTCQAESIGDCFGRTLPLLINDEMGIPDIMETLDWWTQTFNIRKAVLNDIN